MGAIKLHRSFYLLIFPLLLVALPTHVRGEVLPPCPAPITVAEFFNDPIPWATVLVDGGGSAFNRRVVKGLGRTPACANMSYVPPVPFGVVAPFAERGINATVSPSTIALTETFTDVTFDVVGLGVPAPFVVSFPECFPKSVNGTCVNTPASPIVAIRTENPDGSFSGPWSVLWDWKESPVQFDRIGNCTSTAPVGSEQRPSSGPPCTYRVKFLRNPNANNSFSLQKRTQLIVHSTWQGGIALSSDGRGTDNQGGDYTIFSMVLTPNSEAEPPKVETINPQIRQIVSSIQGILRKVQQSFPRSKRTEQNLYASQLRNSSNELVTLISGNAGKIQTSSKTVNMTKLSKSVRSTLLTVLKRNSRTFSADRKRANDAIKALLKGLSKSS